MAVLLWLSFSMLPAIGNGHAQELVDYEVIGRIEEEAFTRSQVMELASYIADVYGPRFSNSPSYNQAIQWARDKFQRLRLTLATDPATAKLRVGLALVEAVTGAGAHPRHDTKRRGNSRGP